MIDRIKAKFDEWADGMIRGYESLIEEKMRPEIQQAHIDTLKAAKKNLERITEEVEK